MGTYQVTGDGGKLVGQLQLFDIFVTGPPSPTPQRMIVEIIYQKPSGELVIDTEPRTVEQGSAFVAQLRAQGNAVGMCKAQSAPGAEFETVSL